MSATIKIFKTNEPEYIQLLNACNFLNKKFSKTKFSFRVGTTYFDYGQRWLWTTILGSDGISSWQCLCPRDQEYIIFRMTSVEEALQNTIDYCNKRLNK